MMYAKLIKDKPYPKELVGEYTWNSRFHLINLWKKT